MDVTIRQLKAFLEVARLRNFRAASVNLGMSQPTLSALLQNLEYTLGAPLFTRTTRRVGLTEEGVHMVAVAEGLTRTFDLVIGNARRDIKDRGNRVSIAISVTSIIPLIFPRLLKKLSQSHPHIKVRLVSGLSRDMIELVALGDADLGIVSIMPDRDRFAVRKLVSDRLVVIGLEDDPVMQDPTPMGWDLLRQQRYLAWNSGGGMRAVIDAVPELAEIMAKSSYEASNWHALKGLIREGLGLAVVPWIIAHQERDDQLAYREIAGKITGREVFVLERRDAVRSEASAYVTDLVQRQIIELTAESQTDAKQDQPTERKQP